MVLDTRDDSQFAPLSTPARLNMRNLNHMRNLHRGLSPSLDFLWLSAHVSGQLEESPWLTNQWVSLIRGWLKSFGTIQAALTVSCSGSLSWPRFSCSPFGLPIWPGRCLMGATRIASNIAKLPHYRAGNPDRPTGLTVASHATARAARR